MTNHLDNLRDLVQIARDGASFYDAAAARTKDPQLGELFRRMGGHKRELISALGGRLEMLGAEAPTSGTVAGAIRKGYAELLAKLSSHDDKIFVSQLEETEDRLLEHFEAALAEAENDEIRSQLQAHLPRVRACHDEMHQWKQRLAA